MNKYGVKTVVTVVSLSALLTACFGESDSGSGTLNLNVTDAPIDSAAKVVVSFDSVEIKPQNGSSYTIELKDSNGVPTVRTIDLLTQQGPNSEPLLIGYTLPAGHYNWIRLNVLESKTSLDSYIELDDGSQFPLYVPSGSETGLKLNRGFDITDGGSLTFTIDFDLRKSVAVPQNGSNAYLLKPSLRIVNNTGVGHITGTVGATTLTDVACTSDTYSVYAFAGENVTPDDIDGLDAEPVSSALLDANYGYSIGFLEAGNYTLGFTCEAGNDDVATDDNIVFISSMNATVTAGATATYDFD